MKKNKTVWKTISIILALAMVVGLMPTEFMGITTEVKAAAGESQEMFADFASTSPSVSKWYNWDSSIAGWEWGKNQTADGYEQGLAFSDWFLSSGDEVTGYAYYTVPEMPAGTYTLSCEVDYIDIGVTTNCTTVYPYIDGAQVEDYSISPYVSTIWTVTSGLVTDGDFSYTFTLDEDMTDYQVGFYVAVTEQQHCHLGSWSLILHGYEHTPPEVDGATVSVGSSTDDVLSALASTVDIVCTSDEETQEETLDLTWDLSEVDTTEPGDYTATYYYTSEYVGTKSGTVTITVKGYELVSVSTIPDVTVLTGTSSYDVISALASTIDVECSDDKNTYEETLDLTWDILDVDTSVEGEYTAVYSYKSDYLGTLTGEITVKVAGISSDMSYIDVVTGQETVTADGEIEWAEGNVDGTFENGTLGTTTMTTNGFWCSSTTRVQRLGTTSAHTGRYAAMFNMSNTNGGGTSLYYGVSESSTTTYSDLEDLTLSASSEYTQLSYTFNATTETMYLHFASNYRSTGTYYYLRACLTELTKGMEYTVSFYYAGYQVSGSYRKIYIDDVVVTYTGEVTKDVTETVYYNYAGTYSADDTIVAAGEISDVSSVVPAYVTADLILADNDYIKEDTEDYDYTITQYLPVTWDEASLAAVDTDTVGTYTITGTAAYGDTSIPVEASVTVTDKAYIDADKVLVFPKKLEYGEGNVDGTFENGTLSLTVPTTNGFYVPNISHITISLDYANNGSRSAKLRCTANSAGDIMLYYIAATTAYNAYTSTKNPVELVDGEESFEKCTWTFTAPNTTTYVSIGASGDVSSSSSASAVVAVFYDCVVGAEYTVSFYHTGYISGDDGYQYVYIDDVVVSYDGEEEVTKRLWYDYAGTYSVDDTTVEAGEADDISTVIPTCITADLVLEDNDLVQEGDEDYDYTTTKDLTVTWDEASLAAIDTDTAGTYTITGTATYGGEEIAVQSTVTVTSALTAPRDAVTDDYGYEGVVYRTTDGTVKLVNGGTLIKGVDLSTVIALEESGATFKDADGNEADIFEILADAGVNYVRIKVYNDDTTVTEIAKRAAAAGLSLYVDFVCADTGYASSMGPSAWVDYTVSEKETALAEYITETLNNIQATGVNIGIVSVGYEINSSEDSSLYTFIGETGENYTSLLSAGTAAVRAFDTNILVALNVSADNGLTEAASYLNGIDYDVLAASYYTDETASMDKFISELNTIASKYGKMTLVAEYSDTSTVSDVIKSTVTDLTDCIGSFCDTDLTTLTGSVLEAFAGNGEDKNMPIDVAKAQVQRISSTDTAYAFRLVGELNRQVEDADADDYDPVENVGFRVSIYDEDGNVSTTSGSTYSYSDKMTGNLYLRIKADGVLVTPSEGYRYFYAYTYSNIPTGKVYYFEVMANSNDIEYCAYYQRESKIYAIYNGHVAVLESADQIGTLTGDDVISME